jgi:CubicO group peptidase (beta-lactamase class C family)
LVDGEICHQHVDRANGWHGSIGTGRYSADSFVAQKNRRSPKDITLRHLVHMTSGLYVDEKLSPLEASTPQMIWGAGQKDMGGYAINVDLAHKPGSHWAYSTPGTTILAKIVADIASPDVTGMKRREVVFKYIRDTLFNPVGITSAVLEFDASGTFLGGSNTYMKARDWARFGYLYLRGGQWEGQQVLPKSWVDFVRVPAPAANNSLYGGQFWLHRQVKAGQWKTFNKRAPKDLFAAQGRDGQYVVIVRSKDLVLVRLGLSNRTVRENVVAAMSEIITSFPDVKG